MIAHSSRDSGSLNVTYDQEQSPLTSSHGYDKQTTDHIVDMFMPLNSVKKLIMGVVAKCYSQD